MEVARLINANKEQAVCMLRDYHLPTDTANSIRHGSETVNCPADNLWQVFFDSLDKFTPDFMESRDQLVNQDREEL